MTHPIPLIVTRADEMVAAVRAGRVVAVLSIEHPGAVIGRGGAPKLAEEGFPDVPQKILSFWDSEEKVTGGPDMAQVTAGLQFIMDNLAAGTVLIHCHAGKARSAAMALGAMALLYPDTDEKDLVDSLLAMRPEAAPNILVLEMLDQLTNRQGRLLRAVIDHPVLSAQRQQAAEARKHWIRRNPEAYQKMNPEKFPKP